MFLELYKQRDGRWEVLILSGKSLVHSLNQSSNSSSSLSSLLSLGVNFTHFVCFQIEKVHYSSGLHLTRTVTKSTTCYSPRFSVRSRNIKRVMSWLVFLPLFSFLANTILSSLKRSLDTVNRQTIMFLP